MNVLEHLQRRRNLEKMNYGAYLQLEKITAVSYVNITQSFDGKQWFEAYGGVITKEEKK